MGSGQAGKSQRVPAERLVEAAAWLFRQGDVEGGLRLLLRALAIDPANTRADAMLKRHSAGFEALVQPTAVAEVPPPVDWVLEGNPLPTETIRLCVLEGSGKGLQIPLTHERTRLWLSPSGHGTGHGLAAVVGPALLVTATGELQLKVDGSGAPVFVSVSSEERITAPAFIRAGRHLFRFEATHAQEQEGTSLYALCELDSVDPAVRPTRIVRVRGPVFSVGALDGDLTFPGDESLAATHFELTPGPWGSYLLDVSGGLGTFLLQPPRLLRRLEVGDRLWVGEVLLGVQEREAPDKALPVPRPSAAAR